MSWREAWRISQPAYAELAFQAIYAARQGNLPPTEGKIAPAVMAQRRVAQSKFLVSLVLGLLTLGSYAILSPTVQSLTAPTLDRGLYVAAILAAVLLLQMALLWWTALQVLPTFLASGTVRFLETMPLSQRTLERVALVLMVRLFDSPALTCLIVTPIVVALALHSWVAGLVFVTGVAVVLVLALALALWTGAFFVRRIQGAHSGHGQTALRWAYLVLWAIPAFAMYGFLSLAPGFLAGLTDLQAYGPAPLLTTVLLAFPLPFGAISAWVATDSGILTGGLPLIAGAAFVYFGLAVITVDWLTTAPLQFARALPEATIPQTLAPVAIVTGHPAVAVIRKDLRAASRNPAYAFVILLPLLDALGLGLLTFISNPTPQATFSLAIAAVVTAALLATFFGPALFAIEVMGYSYTRALPLGDRSIVLGKVALVGAIYLGATGIVVALTLTRVFAPLDFLAFTLAELPAVLAASLLEFGLLFHRARKTGLPIVNLYSGAFWATAVALPGVIVAGVPILAFQLFRGASGPIALPAMGGLAVLELAVCALFALSLTGGRH
ncbi:MAG: hypothetical protein L3K17_03690 [Thermoplasmata archaeon]|nr:hypothetical protein [Thermoplasmata archaeon]